jgi:hypothetical protein
MQQALRLSDAELQGEGDKKHQAAERSYQQQDTTKNMSYYPHPFVPLEIGG